MSEIETNANKDAAPVLLLAAPKATDEVKGMPPNATPDSPAPAQLKRRSTWPYWLAAGFIILAGGETYLFVQQLAHQADKTDLAVLQAQVTDLRANAARTSPVADLITAQAQLAQKQAMLVAQVNALQGQVTSDHTALAALQINAHEISTLTTRMAQLNTLAAARMALEAGQPLGQISNAPAALAVFANTAPPTLLHLKETFPTAARTAAAASLTNDGDQNSFWSKVKLRMEGLITISNGQHVVFGPPAAAALNRMRIALANNDLASAVAAADTLSPAVQTAMTDWLTPARQLLAAQNALANMAKPEQ